jgi:hypothetical protein
MFTWSKTQKEPLGVMLPRLTVAHTTTRPQILEKTTREVYNEIRADVIIFATSSSRSSYFANLTDPTFTKNKMLLEILSSLTTPERDGMLGALVGMFVEEGISAYTDGTCIRLEWGMAEKV